MYNKQMIMAVVEVLKKRFNNLTALELISLAHDILDALEPMRNAQA
jgi:hypothetical protein